MEVPGYLPEYDPGGTRVLENSAVYVLLYLRVLPLWPLVTMREISKLFVARAS